MKLFLRHATAKDCVRRAIKVALLVGTILALINHSDLLFHPNFTAARVLRILLTYFVPYAVATYSSAMEARSKELHQLEEGGNL
ncbi:MAG TPA: nitrate/nitrite transporter NrtS [Acidobacteriota bacterium]|jgi:hypothetical protein|nr:nitrate/nitrite transporter NrtS [Acidobacteriota bacterium]